VTLWEKGATTEQVKFSDGFCAKMSKVEIVVTAAGHGTQKPRGSKLKTARNFTQTVYGKSLTKPSTSYACDPRKVRAGTPLGIWVDNRR